MTEFHDLAELSLNREGQSWGNLGYWQSATKYSDACSALAALLGKQAGLDHRSVVFDAGFGCGDQLLLWLDHFHVARVSGVNLSRSQTACAKARLAGSGYADACDAIVQGDVADPNVWTELAAQQKPSHVLALDCAYHFPDRIDFFDRAHLALARSGRLALNDFLLADGHENRSFQHRLLCWMLKLSRIAEANIVHRDEYVGQLENAGFGDIRMLDISEHVMPAFARAAGDSSPDRGNRNLPWSARVKFAITGRFLAWAYRRSILRYHVISATKIDRSPDQLCSRGQ